MSENKKDKKFWVGRILLVVLLVFAAWLYYQLDLNYQQMETSTQNFETIAAKQAVLTKQYAQQVVEAKQRVAEAEQKVSAAEQKVTAAEQKVVEVQQVVAQLKEENQGLQEKVKLLDKMAELEANITDLRTKNNELIGQIDQLEKDALLHPEKIKTLVEGKEVMDKFRQRVRSLDRRMHEIRRDVFVAKVEAQKELDKKRSLAGNNGFMVRNGMNMPRDIILTTENANVKVDVKFVK